MHIKNVGASHRVEHHQSTSRLKQAPHNQEVESGRVFDSRIGAQRYDASVMRHRLQIALNQALDTQRRALNRQRARTFVHGNEVGKPSNPGEYRTSPPAPGTFDSPRLYAQFIKYHNESDARQASDFQSALYNHKDKTAWLQEFFGALGAKDTARLIGLADIYVADHKSSKLVAGVLTSMVRDNKLSQGDLDNLVRRIPSSQYGAFARVFDNVGSTADSTKLKNMFSESAMALATGSPPFKGVDISPDAKSRFAALATRILASTSQGNQVTQLNHWRHELINELGGSAAKEAFNNLFQSAMGAQRSRSDEPDFSRVTNLVNTLARAGGHYEGSTFVPALLSTKELTQLRRWTFNSAALALSDKKVKENFAGNVTFKDAMASIFTNEFDAIVRSGIGKGKYANLLDNDFKKGLENFFRTALFSDRPATNAKQLLNFVGAELNQIARVLDTGDRSDVRNVFGGLRNRSGDPVNKEQLAGIMGQLLGTVGYAYGQYAAGLNNEGRSRSAAAGLVIDLIAGAAGAAAGPSGPVVSVLTGLISSQATARAKDGLSQSEVAQLKRELTNKYDGKDPEEILKRFVQEIGNRFLEGGEFYDKFSDVSGLSG